MIFYIFLAAVNLLEPKNLILSYFSLLDGDSHPISSGEKEQRLPIQSTIYHCSYISKFSIVTSKGKKPMAEYLREVDKGVRKVEYSIVVPAYNEKKRLPKMLTETIDYMEKMAYNYEIIVVNDASKDTTTEAALAFSNYKGKDINVKVLEYTVNQGKGGAIRSGMMAASGEVILMADADGASNINDFEKCVKALKNLAKNDVGIIAGSRYDVTDNVVERKLHRLFISKVSNFIVQTICGVKIKDTQCGFKFFTKKTAKSLFKPLHIRRFAFDVELFVIANYLDIPYAGVPISWQDVEGSTLNVVTDTIQMARDYILIRLLYVLGLWTVQDSDQIWEAYLPSSEDSRKSPSPGKKPKRE